MVDHADLTAAVAAGEGQIVLHSVFHGRGVDGLAILEGDVGTEVDDQGLGIRPFVLERELRDDLQVFVDVEQLVAETGEDDAPDIGAGERGVEDVGVLAQGDAKGLGLRGGCGEQDGQTAERGQQAKTHWWDPQETVADCAEDAAGPQAVANKYAPSYQGGRERPTNGQWEKRA
jgi:hypothetical protein